MLKKIHSFRLFMILWLGILSIVIAVLLGKFYNFLEKYQKGYEDSRPNLTMNKIITDFENRDMDKVYDYITNIPEITEFETKENIKSYIETVLGDDDITYVTAKNYNEEFPDYHIMAGDYIVADMSLRKAKDKYASYNFPLWIIDSCDFYMDAQYSFTILAPRDYEIYANGVLVSKDYVIARSIKEPAQEYFRGFVQVPTYEKLKVTGLYEKPTITAKDSLGYDVEVTFNKRKGIYEAAKGKNIENEDELKAFAIDFVSDYANYISGDELIRPLEEYFVEDSEMLELIQAGTYRRYFNSHVGTEIRNAKIDEFNVYSKDAVYCRVSLDQAIIFNRNGEEAVIPVNIGVYFIRTDNGFKVCRMQY